jgi:uncharacterized membrane protein YkoI
MRLFLFILSAFIFSSFPVLAQAPLEPAGEGKRDRFSREQSQAVALEQVPGEVIATDEEWENGRFFYEFTIQRPGGSIYEVEIMADTGTVYEIEVVSLGNLRDLPPGLVDRDMAAETAASYIESETKGLGTARLESAATGVYERKIAYVFLFQKSTRQYEVTINAMDGRVMNTRQIN